MDMYRLAVGVLAVWRVAHLFYAEDGPWEVFARIRRLAGPGFWGKLLDCFYCLSLWVAFPFAAVLGTGWKEILLLWPALSGGAILLERVAGIRSGGEKAALYYEEPIKGEDDGVLRSS
jgi:hypothetical protein